MGNDDYRARNQPHDRHQKQRGRDERPDTDYPDNSWLSQNLSVDRFGERPAGEGDLGDAERYGQAYADPDRTTTASLGRKPVENPFTRRAIGVSDNERSDRQDEHQIVVKDQSGKK
jgi:hypothetical protein